MGRLRVFSLVFLCLLVFCFVGLVSASPVLLNEYPYSDYSYDWKVTANCFDVGNYNVSAVGQCFLGTGWNLTQGNFFLKKLGSPTGYFSAAIVGVSGTYGSTDVPAVWLENSSTVYSVASLDSSYGEWSFLFDGNTRLEPYVKYALVIFGINVSSYDVNNCLVVAAGVSGAASGNSFEARSSGWIALGSRDVCFVVWGLEGSSSPLPTYGGVVEWSDYWSGMTVIAQVLVVFILVLVPPLLVVVKAPQLGMLGYFVGMSLMVGIGLYVGLIPFWFLVFVVLALVIIFYGMVSGR